MRYSAVRKTAATIVKQSKEKSWEEFEQKFDTDYRSVDKLFWQTIRCFRGKRTPVATFIENINGVLLKHQKGILNHWREYFCQLLNPITVQYIYLKTSDEQVGEAIHVTDAEASTEIKSLKASKAPGEDDI